MRLISEDPAFTKHVDENGLTFYAGEKLNWSGTRSSGRRAKVYVCGGEDDGVRVLEKHVRKSDDVGKLDISFSIATIP